MTVIEAENSALIAFFIFILKLKNEIVIDVVLERPCQCIQDNLILNPNKPESKLNSYYLMCWIV